MDSTAWLIREIDALRGQITLILGHLFALDGLVIVSLLGVVGKRAWNGRNGRRR